MPANPSAPASVAPVSGAERIATLDVLRGFALFGILVMNIQVFAMIAAAYINPLAVAPTGAVEYAIWLVSHVFFDKKFITLFTMLFGAGIVLMTQRAEAAGNGALALHYRRMIWLLVIGLIHAYLIWYGDILTAYALIGMIAVFMRHWSPRRLVIAGFVLLALQQGVFALIGAGITMLPPEEIAIIADESWLASSSYALAEIEAYRGSYAEQLAMRVEQSLGMQLFGIPTELFFYLLGVMALGMAAFKSGLMTGEWSSRAYARLAVTGLALGLPLIGLGVVMNENAGWEMTFSLYFGRMPNTLAAPLLALAYTALVILAARRFGPAMQAVFAPVGRMAFSNYLAQSIVCTLIFYGHGLGLFMEVGRVGQILIVLAIWIAMPLWSRAWLARFRFGPAEWLWRSLVYRKAQPMLRRASVAAAG
ncbi:DUF418 domain-containing protein [Saliniramus sp.]|uniref:DUF418 domain-containing protein n=1 Tax=Saliniramus sp. TaxID=2986772 RepID=UPI002B5C7ADC|nr:DUF418 domain-containing protein [Saliniramus sp.]HMB09722.1 DUF418 domain-containing protein [Saliniramus sp.]